MSYLKELMEDLAVKAVPKASTGIKTAITKALDTLEAKAKATSNPFDDILILIIRKALGL